MAAVQSFAWFSRSIDESGPVFDPTGSRPEPAEAWNPLSAIRERIGVILVGLLIFSIVLATAGFVASYDARRKTSAFESDSRTAIGIVTNKSTHSVDQAYWTGVFSGHGGDELYRVDLCFRAQDNGYHCGTIGVPNGTYDGLRVGSPLEVKYVSWRPDWFYVGDNAPDDPDSDIFARMFQLCTIAGLLLIIAIAVMVFWHHGDGMDGQSSATKADDVAFRFRKRHGLGRRRGAG